MPQADFNMPKRFLESIVGTQASGIQDHGICRRPQGGDGASAVPFVARDKICQNARIYTLDAGLSQLLMPPPGALLG